MSELVSAEQVYVPVEGLEVSEVPDGRVIYQADKQRVHYLNPTALVVYELCADKQTVGAIVDFLQQAYQLPAPPTAEVNECIGMLIKEGLVQKWSP